MKLKDILDVANQRSLQFRTCGWKVNGSGIVKPLFPLKKLTPNTDVEVAYYWYHHCNPDLDQRAITEAIEKHNFNAFCKLRRRLGDACALYLPDTAVIMADYEVIGTLHIAHDEKIFNLISVVDCECG